MKGLLPRVRRNEYGCVTCCVCRLKRIMIGGWGYLKARAKHYFFTHNTFCTDNTDERKALLKTTSS